MSLPVGGRITYCFLMTTACQCPALFRENFAQIRGLWWVDVVKKGKQKSGRVPGGVCVCDSFCFSGEVWIRVNGILKE